MARDGEIQNSDLLQGMRDFLNIGGVKQYPKVLDVGDVKVVYDLAQANAAASGEGTTYTYVETSIDLEGVNEWEKSIVDDGSLPGSVPNGIGKSARLDTLSFELTVDPANRATIVNKHWSLLLSLYVGTSDGTDPFYVIILNPWFKVEDVADQSRLIFRWALGGGHKTYDADTSTDPGPFTNHWDGRISGLANSFFGLKYHLLPWDHSTNFPAGTTMDVRGIVRVSGNGVVPRP